MRVYLDGNEKDLISVTCNKCQKSLLVEKGILKEGCFYADTIFGYFSEKDGVRHQFDLCEECYNKMIQKFELPPQEIEMKELL